MLRLTLRNLLANKARFVMTTFAVVLGVSFVVASFVLSDGLRSTFNSLSEEITSGTDLVVRPVSEFGEPEPLDIALVDEIAAIDGVAAAAPYVEATENAVQPIKADGTTIPTQGPPQLMFGWVDNVGLGSFTIVEGAAPDELAEFAMDIDAAELHGFEVGERYDLVTPSGVVDDFELVATTSFGEDNATVGATLMHVSLDQAQDLFGTEGTVSAIPIDVAPGADLDAVNAAVATIVGDTQAEIVDQATITSEQQSEFNQGVTIVGNVLLGFAIVSLFVSIFIIYNTFAIVLGQRIKELALLRAIGAEARQLRRSVLGEAFAVGLIASLIGLVAGIGVARGLTQIFALIGAELPSYPTILAARTVAVALILGVGVTLVSALIPARAAATVPPVAALRDGATITNAQSHRRLVAGAGIGLAGLAAGIFALFGPTLSTLGLVLILGAAGVGVFLGLALVSPVFARPVTSFIGWPLGKLMGRAGVLATGNASRNPRRTATTGAALMIGLSLVTMGYVVGESVKTSLGNLISSTVSADYLITEPNGSGIPPMLAEEMVASGRFSDVVGVRYDEARLGGDIVDIAAVDLAGTDRLFDLDVAEGAIPAAGDSDLIVIHEDLATDLGVGAGDLIPIEFASGYSTELEVAAVYADATIFETPIVPNELFDLAGASTLHEFLAAELPTGVEAADVAPLIGQLEQSYPQVTINTASEFQASFESTIDSALLVINVLLALAIIIALIGVANTLALSVTERTRELGLLRAVGMSRRQMRRMIRWEAVLIALFGAVLGVASGLVFGWGAVSALPSDTFGGSFTVPVGDIVVMVVLAGAATLVAAWLPAHRAGRLNVLDAISH
ncbi:MAG: FtsX-like permease family protein [Actinomycetia bacterium]|nr:FtsX-like permease family protein [Actinomycetes bacterium]